MRREASSCPSTSTSTPPSTSTSTLLFSPGSNIDHKPWVRARRQTDPFTRTSIPELVRPARHSADSTPRATTTTTTTTSDDYFGRGVPRTTSFSQSSTIISSEGLSNPALAGFTPRKINALKGQATPACNNNNNNPTLFPTLTPSPRSFPSSLPTLKVPPTTVTRDEPDNNENQDENDDNENENDNYNDRLSPPSYAAANSYSKPQSALSASSEPRSPHPKRAPASRSSYGIETASGPPPALSTQRTLSQDKLWRSSNSVDPANSNKSPPQSPEPQPQADAPIRQPSSIDAVLKSESSTTPTPDKQASPPPPEQERAEKTEKEGEMSTMGTRNGRTNYANDLDRTIRGPGYINTDSGSRDSSNEENTSNNEDLFLNIAKSSSDRRDPSGRNERRRSKFGIPTFSSRTIRASEQTPSPEQTRYADHVTPLQSQNASPSVQYNPSNKPSPITAHPLDEVSRRRYFGVSPRTSTGYTRTRLNRTSRETSPEAQENHTERQAQSVVQEPGQSRRYQQSNLSTSRTNRHQSFSGVTERQAQEAEKSRVDGTESTLSTTAPSTVWDELDDLKGRIRKLELTGKLPTSSAAAMSHASAERPRTATTTVTTISSSPKHGRKAASPLEPSESGRANQIRTLLQSALEKTEPILNKEVYKTLEATATDALALANMLGPSRPQSSGTSVVSGSGNPERQAQRKADSMCRSLTELCLALSDEKLISLPNQRPGSRDTTSNNRQANSAETESSTPTVSYRRSASHEPEEMRWPQNNRASGQLESRRNSRLSINAGSRLSQETNQTIPTPTYSTPPNHLSRASTTLRARRGQAEDDPNDRQSFISRPISRAMTEFGNSGPGHQRFSPRDRTSLQLNQTPEEQQQPRNSSLAQSALPLRRNYVSPSTQVPTASPSNIQPGFRRYGGVSASSTPGSAANNVSYDGPSDDSPLQQQRTQLRGPSSASRNPGRISDVQPLRSRTNSVGTRRFGLRSRQVTMNMDGRDGISPGYAE